MGERPERGLLVQGRKVTPKRFFEKTTRFLPGAVLLPALCVLLVMLGLVKTVSVLQVDLNVLS